MERPQAQDAHTRVLSEREQGLAAPLPRPRPNSRLRSPPPPGVSARRSREGSATRRLQPAHLSADGWPSRARPSPPLSEHRAAAVAHPACARTPARQGRAPPAAWPPRPGGQHVSAAAPPPRPGQVRGARRPGPALTCLATLSPPGRTALPYWPPSAPRGALGCGR